nr:unnamed protein product [Digitaria exilis]
MKVPAAPFHFTLAPLPGVESGAPAVAAPTNTGKMSDALRSARSAAMATPRGRRGSTSAGLNGTAGRMPPPAPHGGSTRPRYPSSGELVEVKQRWRRSADAASSSSREAATDLLGLAMVAAWAPGLPTGLVYALYGAPDAGVEGFLIGRRFWRGSVSKRSSTVNGDRGSGVRMLKK